MNIFVYLVDEYNKGNIKLEIEINGIIYDSNFAIGGNTCTLTANCLGDQTQQLAVRLDDLEYWVSQKEITIRIKVKNQ